LHIEDPMRALPETSPQRQENVDNVLYNSSGKLNSTENFKDGVNEMIENEAHMV